MTLFDVRNLSDCGLTETQIRAILQAVPGVRWDRQEGRLLAPDFATAYRMQDLKAAFIRAWAMPGPKH